MSARRAAKAGAAVTHDGTHRPGIECPWSERQCSGCVQEFAIHTGWELTGLTRPWGDGLEHDPKRCFTCRGMK